MLKTGFTNNNENKKVVNWDKEAVVNGGFKQEQWNQVRNQIDNNLVSLTPEFLINRKGNQLKSRKTRQTSNFLTRHGIHKDNNYFQIYYREKLLKEQMAFRGWNSSEKMTDNNYLVLALKKADENNQEYIYNFLHFTRINKEDFEGKNSWYTLFRKINKFTKRRWNIGHYFAIWLPQ
jgi:hypothetical protein